MKNAKWLYRLEAVNADNGLWYDTVGNYVFGIGEIDGCQTKTLPMGYDERYRKDGRHWFSSCSYSGDLAHWYSLADARELMEKGFRFTMWLATEYEEYENETCFIKETSIGMKVLSFEELSEIFNANKNR